MLRALSKWLSPKWSGSPKARTIKPIRLHLESLEDRVTPTTWTWQGTMNTGTTQAPVYDWQTPGNFAVLNSNGTVAYLNSATNEPTNGDDLSFPTLPNTTAANDPRYVTTNNLGEFTLNSITLASNGYDLKGNTVDFAPTSGDAVPCGIRTTNTPNSTVAAAGTGNSVDLSLKFNAAGEILSGYNPLNGLAKTTLNVNGTTTINGNFNLTVSGVSDVNFTLPSLITGAGNLVKGAYQVNSTTTIQGTGILTLDAVNNYTGTTTVTQGVTFLSSPSNYAIPGNLTIGNGTGSATNTAVVKFSNNINQIALGATVSINKDGTLNLNGWGNTVGPLALTGGTIVTGDNGLLTLGGDVTTYICTQDSTISGHLALGTGNNGARSFNVAAGSAGDADLWIKATVANSAGSANVSLSKFGDGWMWLDPLDVNGSVTNNTYTGQTVVTSGTLDVESSHALGNSAGTIVNNGDANNPDPGTLYLYTTSTLTIKMLNGNYEPLTLNGPGDWNCYSADPSPGGGALQGDGPAGSVITWPGAVSPAPSTICLASPSTICAGGGGIEATAPNGNEGAILNITGVVSGSGTLTKSGPGTLRLDQYNTYTGATTVVNGILRANYGDGDANHVGTSSLGADSGVTVSGLAAGNEAAACWGTLQLEGGVTFNNEALTLAGNGFGSTIGNSSYASTNGDVDDNSDTDTNYYSALHSAGTATNTWNGSVFLAATSQMNVDHGGTLVINGPIADAAGIAGASNTLSIGKQAKPTTTSYGLPDGVVEFTANNTYADATVVNLGILEAANVYALGSPVNADGTRTTATTTTVNYVVKTVNGISGVTYAGTLELTSNGQAALTFDANEALNLSGPGFTSLGALFNLNGNNNWEGNVTLVTATQNSTPPYPGAAIGAKAIGIASSPTGAIESANNTVTITTTAAHGFVVGQWVSIAGVGIPGYNGTFQITSVPNVPNPTTFTYTDPTPNLAASGGGTASTNLTIDGVVGSNANDATSALTKVRDGIVTLTNSNTYTGLTTVSAGTLAVKNSGALGTWGAAANGTTVSSGATLQLLGGNAGLTFGELLTLNGTGVGSVGALQSGGNAITNTWNGQITLASTSTVEVCSGTTLTVGTTTGGKITGAGGLTKIDAGILDFSGQAANDYVGDTTIQAGTLQVNNPNYGIKSGSTSTISVFSGASLTGTGGISAGTVTNAGTVNFSGYVIAPSVSNSGTFTGNVTITTTTKTNTNGTFANSGIFNVTGTITGNVTNSGTINPGGAGSVGTLTVSGSYTQNSGGTFSMDVNASGQFDQLVVSGSESLVSSSHLIIYNSQGIAVVNDTIADLPEGTPETINGVAYKITYVGGVSLVAQ